MANQAIQSPGKPSLAFTKNPFLWLAGLAMILATVIVMLMRPKPTPELPVLGILPAFQLTNQDQKSVNLNDFKGSVHVINFIFTSCPDVCPLLTKQMVKMQKRAADLKIPVKFASISVNPNTDTPEVLKDYATRNGADTSNWSFLTGPLEAIEKVVLQGFKVGLDHESNPDGILDVTHSEHFVILDQEARIRAYKRAANSDEIDGVLADVKTLL